MTIIDFYNLREEGITKQMRRLKLFMMESPIIDIFAAGYGNGPDIHALAVQLNYNLWLMRTEESYVNDYASYVHTTAKFRVRARHLLSFVRYTQ